ncbi:hypothetical protein Nepgr_028884 [Nepenthes gracilis]|uniref:Uncharacterized protein n=1 Tax=Nepenthes gracilis TaxID=150966 RepID=A0AAD3TDC6_NEPGR|nr:hypothetical protein Nepgr_028884 [Nepenthes gracilis]
MCLLLQRNRCLGFGQNKGKQGDLFSLSPAVLELDVHLAALGTMSNHFGNFGKIMELHSNLGSARRHLAASLENNYCLGKASAVLDGQQMLPLQLHGVRAPLP